MLATLAARLNPLLPHTCLLCGERGGARRCLCPPCEAELPWLTHHCRRCALPLAADADWCGHCQQQPPAFDRCVAAFPYTAPVSQLVSRFKHQGNLVCGRLLTELLGERLRAYAEESGEAPDLISPVPLHWRRQLARGFNQAAYIAGGVGWQLGIPVVNTARRVRATGSQQALKRKARLRNLRDAFAVASAPVADKHIALVDDVVTTGATAETLSRLYRDAGARRVEVWALARTPQPGHS